MPIPVLKRLVPLRSLQIIRYIQSTAQPKYGPGFHVKQYSSCSTEKQKATYLMVNNPGTSFARVVPQTPVFANFPVFPQPCSASKKDA